MNHPESLNGPVTGEISPELLREYLDLQYWRCPTCNELIDPGERVAWGLTVRLVHLGCASVGAAPERGV